MNSKNFYITTPIYYVNDKPHIGHAYTTIICDVISRFKRLQGFNVHFLTGTDEHGLKIEESAKKNNLSTELFTDKNSGIFRQMMEKLNISNDDFIRTSEDRHKQGVKALWNKLLESGDIYLGKYSGWYSVRDEAFYSEKELTTEGFAPTGAPVEWIEEASYFFALSKWQDKLLQFYKENPEFIFPDSRRNEVISFVEGGLNDLSISRTSFKWGVEVPNDPEHIIYVWLDALTNYISAVGYPDDELMFEKNWPADLHVVGKDILRFHAVYWPAFLMAAEIDPPKKLIAHGWWTNDGQKMSKSLGNVIDPEELINEFGLDQTRYFLIREISLGNDGNFSKNNMMLRCNSELSNKIGNLLQRSLSFIYKNCDQAIPRVSEDFRRDLYNSEIFKNILKLHEENIELINEYKINKILDNIINIAEIANSYIDHEAPWSLKNTNIAKMNEILYSLVEISRILAIMLRSFVPNCADMMLDQLGISASERKFENIDSKYSLQAGCKINEPKPIFPRINL